MSDNREVDRRGPATPIAVVVNPRSANGRTARIWGKVQRQLEAALGPVEVFETSGPLHATELTRWALRCGSRTVIAVGGDGTINEVVNGFFEGEQPVSPEGALGLIPQGTGSDFRRTVGIPLEESAAIEIIRRGQLQSIDLVKVRYQAREGQPGLRYGINITSFGMGGAVAARANRSFKVLGGRLTFQLATLLTTLTFRGNTINLRLDDQPPLRIKVSNVAIGNAQFHGAGMWVCPRAVVDDGLLEVTVIRYLSPWGVVRALGWLYNGRLLEHPKVESYQAQWAAATSEEQTLIEVDGEPVGQLPVEISVLPQGLSMYGPGGSSAKA